MNDQWQDKLRDRMERHEEPAPEGLWEGIEQRITVCNLPGERSGSNNGRMRAVRIGAVVAVAAATVILFFLVRVGYRENKTEAVLTGKTVTVVPQQEQFTAESTSKLLYREPEVLLAAKGNNEVAAKEGSKESNAPETVEKDIHEEHPEGKEAIAKDSDVDTRVNGPTRNAGKPALNTGNGNDRLLAMNARRDHQNQPKWQTSLSMSNFPSGASETFSGYGTFALAETVEEQYHFLPNFTREQVYTDVKHHQPITLGITLRYNFNERWSVASGLTYTLLSSELRAGSGNYYYDDRQTLHYIGIPVNVGYTFWQNNKITTYLSSGGLVEKIVAGRLTSHYYLDNKLEATTRESISSRELQWSVNTALGVGYQISNNIGLYAEPGISYYFKNSSELETIYKDNPLHFNLRLGLRFTLND